MIRINWKELWRYRDLFLVFSWRDISVRYKQTVLGALWAIFQPFINMIIFTFIFNRMANIQSGDGTPYPIFLYVGLLFWQYYSGTLTKASASMVSNANIIQKVYFPRLIVPASTAITGLVDMFMAGIILVGLMFYYHFHPLLVGVVLFPVLLICSVLSAMGLGMYLASLNIKYRDVGQALPFIIQTLMYVTPVIYPVRMLDHHPLIKNLMLWLNPMSGVISTARVAILGHGVIDWKILGISILMSCVLFAFGLYYFRATERYFADIV
jgi:lipopolysaccharide transport system permease protein